MTDTNGEPVQAETSETEKDAATRAEDPEKAKKKRGRAGLKERLKTAEEEAADSYQRLLRATAEFENYKKRNEREMNDLRKFANESLLKEILPTVDNLERALAIDCKENEDAFKGIHEGVEMTLKGLLDNLRTFGVVPMEALEKPFDPHFHQAVSQQESDQYPKNTVLQELQKGYMLRDRLLRPAMVLVSKKPDTKVDVKSEEPDDTSATKVTIR